MRLPATDNDDKYAFFARMILAEIPETVIKDIGIRHFILYHVFSGFSIFYTVLTAFQSNAHIFGQIQARNDFFI